MGHTVTARFDKNQGLYFYYLDGAEFLRTIDPFMFATIYTRQNAGKDTGESVWVFPTRTNRKATRKVLENQGCDFWGVTEISFI